MTPSAPAWLDELDLHVGPPEASMGTRALDPATWFVVDDEWDGQRAEAHRVLATARDEVLVGSGPPDVGHAARSLQTAVVDWLAVRAPRADSSVPADEPDPLAATRLLVADDVCVLLPGADGWQLAAGCVCFPSYWRPRDRIGRGLDGVHATVPGYPGPLAERVDGFLDRIRPGRGVWRRNWSIHDVPDLHLPAPVPVARPTPVPQGRWLRSERQTLVRLPGVDAVVFTIRTQQVPLAVLGERPEIAGGLASALRGWTAAQHAYKGAAVDDALLTWLESR